MSNENNDDKIINRIRALLSLSKSSHSQAEKETAATMAQKLIVQYQIEQVQIDAANSKAAESDNLEGVVIFESGRTSLWKQVLIVGVVELNGCYCLTSSGVRGEGSHRQGTRWRVFGKPTDIELTKYMFDYLLSTISDLAQRHVPSNGRRGVNVARESWCYGCINGFLDKMRKERKLVLSQANQSTAMVLVNRPKEIGDKVLAHNQALNKNFHITQRQGSKARKDANFYGEGYTKGQTITVNPGINGETANKLYK